jgi:hypothetical protein
LIEKKLISLVRPGVFEILARPSLFVRRLIKEDLPTLDRPMKANSGKSGARHLSKLIALVLNFEV